jgi:hypothetical protein
MVPNSLARIAICAGQRPEPGGWLWQYDPVSECWRTADGWAVEVIRLEGTPDHHDGTWIRITHHGFYIADVSDPYEIRRWVRPGELEPDALTSRARPQRRAYHARSSRADCRKPADA